MNLRRRILEILAGAEPRRSRVMEMAHIFAAQVVDNAARAGVVVVIDHVAYCRIVWRAVRKRGYGPRWAPFARLDALDVALPEVEHGT